MLEPKTVESWIKEGMEPEYLKLEGDGRHFEAFIVSKAFEGLRPLARHRLVYTSLGVHMDEIHALSIKAYTPEEAKNLS